MVSIILIIFFMNKLFCRFLKLHTRYELKRLEAKHSLGKNLSKNVYAKTSNLLFREDSSDLKIYTSSNARQVLESLSSKLIDS